MSHHRRHGPEGLHTSGGGDVLFRLAITRDIIQEIEAESKRRKRIQAARDQILAENAGAQSLSDNPSDEVVAEPATTR